MNRKGDLIFWEITDFNCSKEKLADLGFDRLLPRNDYKTAMVKALRAIVKGNDRLYRRFNDVEGEVSFGVFVERVDSEDISIDKECILKVNKLTGHVEYLQGDPVLHEKIGLQYNQEQGLINAHQFRTMVLQVVRKECYGSAMRKGGGVYFIDKQFDELRGKLSELFNAFPESCRLHTVPIYDDASTLDALEFATSEDIFADINEIIDDVKAKLTDKSITKRILDNRQEQATEILKKIKIHESSLRDQADRVKGHLENVVEMLKKVCDEAGKIALDPEDFVKELQAL